MVNLILKYTLVLDMHLKRKKKQHWSNRCIIWFMQHGKFCLEIV